MAANRRKQDDKNLEILRELISHNGNNYCFDCNQRGPTYVNTTIGSFVCSKCSGMLRGLTPPHRVKSISMATFTPEEIEFIKSRGNQYSRRVWLGLYDGESVNFADEQSVKDFMSDKYEKKRYYLDAPVTNHVNNGTVITPQPSKNKTKIKNSISANNAPLISISPQNTKSNVNNNSITSNGLLVSNLLPLSNEVSHKKPRPVNNLPQSLGNPLVAPTVAAAPAPVPDFPVDFSTANIYNSSQWNVNNNNVPQPAKSSFAFGGLPSNNSTATNDRYAALADLDSAFRQQNNKNIVPEESPNLNNKNPFQSSASDLFTNRNPFFNGAWNAMPATFNPFSQSTNNNGSQMNSNPFL